MRSLITLAAAGEKSREEIVDYFAQLYRGKLRRKQSQVWNEFVSCTSELYPAELLDDIKQAFQDGLVEPGYIDWHDIERQMSLGREQALERLAADNRLVDDTIAEMEWWACFQDYEPSPAPSAPRSDWAPPFPVPPASVRDVLISPVVRDKPKTGRNEPCPCGTGKKYKKCHWSVTGLAAHRKDCVWRPKMCFCFTSRE